MAESKAAMSERTNIYKLRKIREIITAFNTGLQYRPFNDRIDQARTAAILSEVLNVLWKETKKEEAEPPVLYTSPVPAIDPEVQKELNMGEIKKIQEKKRVL